MKILIIGGDASSRSPLGSMLERAGHTIRVFENTESALHQVEQVEPDLVLLDLMLPGMTGLELMEEAERRFPSTPFLMVIGRGTVDTAVQALKLGTQGYITRPMDELLRSIRENGRGTALQQRNAPQRAELHRAQEADQYPTVNSRMQAILQQARRAAQTDVTILLSGENGTGKDLMARYIHTHSLRAGKPFVAVHCGALSDQLFESELFGHAKGAFTGAYDDHRGYFEVADQGTLFLNEVGELSERLQVKLLHVLQEREFSRVGETRVRSTDVRIIAATNRELGHMLASGQLRHDFFYRINSLHLHLLPLREREEDILFLFERFVQEFAIQHGREIPEITSSLANDVLVRYDWPGNVRELRNLAERTMVLWTGGPLDPASLPNELSATAETPSAVWSQKETADFKESRRRFEVDFISTHLAANNGNIAATARQIGLHPVTLQKKVAQLGIDRSAFVRN